MFTSLTPVRGNVPCCVRSCGKTISGFASFVLGNFLQVTTSSHFLCVDIYIYMCVCLLRAFFGQNTAFVVCVCDLSQATALLPTLRAISEGHCSQKGLAGSSSCGRLSDRLCTHGSPPWLALAPTARACLCAERPLH